MNTGTDTSYKQYLREVVRPQEGDIPAFIFSDPDVYKLEIEQIFHKTWVFVAHESEIPEPGDYVSRQLGEWPVIVARGEDGVIRIFLNACRHKGMRVCNAELGNSSHFRCPYHGFTYSNKGDLIGVPYQKEVYGNVLKKEELGLLQARAESYRGLIFGTWNQQAESLNEFLGGMKWYLDIIVGRAEMEVVGPPQKWIADTDWKLAADNFVSDSYHTMFAHRSIGAIGEIPRADYFKDGYQISLENGHGLGMTANHEKDEIIFAEELRPEFEKNLTQEHLDTLKFMVNSHGNVSPNLSFLISEYWLKGKKISFTTLRLWHPVGPGKTEVLSWFLVEKNAPEWWRELSKQVYVINFGSSGMFEQDDTECWWSITSNAKAPISFKYIQGLGDEPIDHFPGPGRVYLGKWREANARSFFQWWLDRVTAD